MLNSYNPYIGKVTKIKVNISGGVITAAIIIMITNA